MEHHDLDLGMVDPRIQAAADEGCEESRLYLSRRAVLGVTATLSAWAFLPRSASAAGDNLREKRLFVVLLQGGMDGLHAVPPIHDRAYVAQRRLMALKPETLLPLDGEFYFNTSMPNFYRAYQERQAAIVHAIAPPLRIRSHFECMYNLESGMPGEQVRSSKTGWMNRLLDHLPLGDDVMSNGLRLGDAPLILTGPQQVLTWTPDRWPRTTQYAQALYDTPTAADRSDKTDPVLSDLMSRGKRIREIALSASDRKPIVNAAFHGAGNLMKAPNGPRISAMQIVGFDTHFGETHALAGMLGSLDTWLQVYKGALGDEAWANTVVVCVSEFGRTVRDNGGNGTDHGVGTAAFLIGGAVNGGGRVRGDWPGLTSLWDGRDLRATTCTRSLFKGILKDHLGITREALDNDIFPDSADVLPMEGLIRT